MDGHGRRPPDSSIAGAKAAFEYLEARYLIRHAGRNPVGRKHKPRSDAAHGRQCPGCGLDRSTFPTRALYDEHVDLALCVASD